MTKTQAWESHALLLAAGLRCEVDCRDEYEYERDAAGNIVREPDPEGEPGETRRKILSHTKVYWLNASMKNASTGNGTARRITDVVADAAQAKSIVEEMRAELDKSNKRTAKLVAAERELDRE